MTDKPDVSEGPNGFRWGTERCMNALETVMWRVEADARFRSPMMVVELLDSAPDWARLRAAHDWATRMVPRFRQRVIDPPLGLAAPVWATDPHFDLDYHLRRTHLPGGGTLQQVLDLAQAVAMAPFDRARPLWESTLVEGLHGGRAAYLLKLHHSVTDGIGGIQLLGRMHSRTREHDARRPEPPPPPPDATTPASALLESWLERVRAAPGAVARASAFAVDFVRRVVGNPKRGLADFADIGLSLLRVAKAPAPASPLLAGRSLSYRYIAHEVPLDALKQAAKAVDGTVNDAYLAAICIALRRYHEHHGARVHALPMSIPVNLRRDDDPMGSNRIGAIRLAAPLEQTDARDCIRAVHAQVQRARRDMSIDVLAATAPVLAMLPTPLLVRSFAEMMKDNDVQASNVPGLAEPRYFAGARVTHMFPFGPLPGCAVMIAMVSHSGICCIGANVDPAAVTDLGAFADCLRAGFGEVLALASPAPPPSEPGKSRRPTARRSRSPTA